MKDNTQGLNRERIWSLLYTSDEGVRDAEIARLSAELHISAVTARLLYNRGYTHPDAARAFMSCDEQTFHDPFLMKDMMAGVQRTLEALAKGEKIAIYGDYDVDGVTSVTCLHLYLTGLGARVMSYIPSRQKEGYGMSLPVMDKLAEEGVDLIITVDTGITAIEETAYAKSLGIDTVVADLLPHEKVQQLEKILDAKGKNSKVCYVGDGINDAPVLARADVGIAMGALGSDAAIEAADVVIMNDEIGKIATAVNISKKTLCIVKQNIVFAIGVKLFVLLLVALGHASMWSAVFADVGVAVIAILNAIRALDTKNM